VTIAVITSLMLGSLASEADDLQALKEAAGRYVIAIKAVLGTPEAADCSAREAIPSLIQMAKGGEDR
jgi:hypothetical protein